MAPKLTTLLVLILGACTQACSQPRNLQRNSLAQDRWPQLKRYIESSIAQPSALASYKRKEWPHWSDDDGDCRTTRHEVLAQTSTRPVNYEGTGCRVVSGRWVDAYSGRIFRRAADLDIDHLVPLKEAHISGGALWSRRRKKAFANDRQRFHLIPVQRALNRRKGAKDPARWLPPKRRAQCAYLFYWTTIKKRYRLKFDPREAAFIIDHFHRHCLARIQPAT